MSLSAPIASETRGLDLDEVLDQHAELRDVAAQLRQATDTSILSGGLQRLHDLLQHHFAQDEANPALREALGESAAGSDARRAPLLAEHPVILAAVRRLVARVETSGEGSAAAFAAEVGALLSRIAKHDAQELRRFGACIDAAAEPTSPSASSALAVNLRRTAIEVAIPREHAVLLDMAGTRQGVREATRKLLREAHHRYASWPETLEELHRHAMGDLPYYLEHPQAADAIAVFDALYARVVEHAREAAVRETAVRQWLAFLEKVVCDARDALPRVAPALERAASRLELILEESPALAIAASGRLRHLAESLEDAPPEGLERTRERVRHLLVSALRRTVERWLKEPDAEVWWQERCGAAPLPEAIAEISHARLREHLARLDAPDADRGAAGSRTRQLLALPDHGRIARLHLEAIPHVTSASGAPEADRIARIQWQIRMLSIEALAPVHRQALTEIDHAYRGALLQSDPAGFAALVQETFEALRRSPLASTPAAFGLMARIGIEVLRSNDPERVAQVIDAIQDVDFPGPSFAGFTGEWRARIDPAHLAAIRCWLEVIRESPPLALPLVTALTVHLKVGGIFVADTDLFQKDVSALLNRGVGPVYHPVKQLLRLFPIYFDEIGAEGPLRDVSSRIDEIQARQDPLCHFLRKQCHVECNPRVLALIEAIGAYWASGDPTPLRAFLPAALYDRVAAGEGRSGAHRAFACLTEPGGVAAAFARTPAEIEARLDARPDLRPADREKAALLVRLHGLVRRKYALDHDDLLDRLARFHRVEPHELEALQRALDADRHEEAVGLLLDWLERVKEIVTSPAQTQGHEEIYRKRHIAVGIPSLYGRYREEKLEALGLGFRIESLATALFERMLAETPLEVASRDTLRRVARWLRLLLRALRLDGCQARGLEIGTAMLERVLEIPRAPLSPYVDVFQVLERGVEQLVRIRFVEPYEEALERILGRRHARKAAGVPPAEALREQTLEASEAFLRNAIASSFGLQTLDRLVARMLQVLTDARDALPEPTGTQLVGLDLERCCVPIDACENPRGDPILLGNKGYLLERLARLGLPVPPGFVVTTEAHRGLEALRSSPPLRRALHDRVRAGVARIERATGCRFGDPRRPLLLSVRSSAAISMPGVLDTFLDVGINEELAAGLARVRGPWGAWDAYRRFLQFWGMGHGIPRSAFDALMRATKAEQGVAKKAEIPPPGMRELASRYRQLLEARGVPLAEEPALQLERCIDMVMDSWQGEKARAYRAALQISDAWGTAVVVQGMVYGNLGRRSGTGVAFTCDPRRPTGAVELHGDFVVQGQGDDVVGGLVSTFPLGEAQRRSERPGCPLSLERDFPRIHRALQDHARALLRHQDRFHQEIEFTFESDDPKDLHVLQTRDLVMEEVAAVSAFVPGPDLERDRLARGIGAGGGCVSGRVARSAEEVAELRAQHPGDPVVLLRPDTVPDDIPLVLAVDGLVTAIGGATSHAALVAQRLGRSCVVGCRELEVDDGRGAARIAGHAIAKGEMLSISGIDGSIYRGRHPATTVRRRRLL